jgi:hypothetical protein
MVPTIYQVQSSDGFDRNWGSRFRDSKHSLTGCCFDVLFPLREEAGRFAALWAKAIHGRVKVRFDGLFKVSVPVQKPSF